MSDWFWGNRRFGLVRIRRHLAFGSEHGAMLWAPAWLKYGVADVWNWLSCHTLGHDTLGPWEEPPDEDGRTIRVKGFRPGYFPKTCTACGRRWPEES